MVQPNGEHLDPGELVDMHSHPIAVSAVVGGFTKGSSTLDNTVPLKLENGLTFGSEVQHAYLRGPSPNAPVVKFETVTVTMMMIFIVTISN